jgi:hypothetical protein
MSPWDASMWLCKRLDIDPAMLGFDVNPDIKDDPDDPQPEPDPQPPPGSTSDLPEIFWFGQENVEVDRRWLVDGLLPEAGVAIVAGQWGTYKTFSVLDLCAAIMAGESFIDYPILRKGGVLFIAGEGAEDLPIRIQAAVEARGLREAPFAWVRECPPLVDSKSTGFLITLAIAVNDEMLKRFGVPLVLIAFDTVGSLAGYKRGGDENDAAIHLAIVKRMRRAVERVPLLALGVDHFGKAPETGTRGSSAKEAGVDTVLALLGEKDISGKVTDSRMAVRKNRSGPQGREIAFSVKVVTVGTDDRGEPITTLTIEWKPGEGSAGPAAKAKADSWSKSLRLLRTILMDVLASDAASNQRPFADGPVVRAVDLGLVREEFGKRYPTEGDRDQRRKARSAAFQRAITGAQAKGLVGIRDIGTVTYVWLAVPESQSSTS